MSSVRRDVREALITLAALILWPSLTVLAAVVIVRRRRRREQLLSRLDLQWVRRRTLLALGGFVVLRIGGTLVVAIYSIFGSVPDI